MPDVLWMWVVYFGTSDYPGLYVLRRSAVSAGSIDTDMKPIATAKTLNKILRHVPRGLAMLSPSPDDDPVILAIFL